MLKVVVKCSIALVCLAGGRADGKSPGKRVIEPRRSLLISSDSASP